MSGDALNIGLSGLLAFQRAIATASNNVSNVDTPGYSRQSLDLSPRSTSDAGAGALGGGVGVDAIRRENDRFLTEEVFTRTSERSDAQTRARFAERVTGLIGDPDAGLSAALDGLLPALEAAAADPASVSVRSALLSTLEGAVGRLGAFTGALGEIRSEALARMDTAVSDVNALAAEIAELNNRIALSGGNDNALRDARDRMLGQMSERVDVTTVEARDGSISVFAGGQLPLVVGGIASELTRVPGEPVEIVLSRRGSTSNVTTSIRGGEIGGLLGAIGGEIETAQAGLDRVALGLAASLNDVQQRGIDLDGDAGGPLLTTVDEASLVGDRVLAETGNAGSASLALTVDDVGAISTEPMRLVFDGAAWNLLDVRGSVLDSFATLPRSFPPLGFSLASVSGAPAPGDAFVLRPAAGAARGLEVRIDDPRRLALASPVDAAGAATNAGSARIEELTLDVRETAATATDLPAPVTLTYDAGAGAFIVSAPPGGSLPYDASVDSGVRQALAVPGYGTLGFEVAGTPENGDVITLSARPVGAGDERNARAFVETFSRGLFAGGTLSLADGPGRLLGELASSTRSHAFDVDASDALFDRAVAAREEVSGVNLDEEAADLLRFQQAYEASARVIAVSGQLFRTLLNAVGG